MLAMVRKLLLSALLALTIAPAFSQAPPPVPGLPDTERRTTYSLSGSTCACAVGFALYGDSTDYGNWLEVFVNGVLVTSGNYTITSPTGALATIPRPITDAVLTFNSAQTGTVQIVGARRPRRVAQFTEGRGVAARDLNQALTDIVAQNREVWDKLNDVTGRSILAAPGESLALLPAKASRANLSACFDTDGNLTSCVSAPSSSTFSAGSGITFTGTNPTVISANQSNLPSAFDTAFCSTVGYLIARTAGGWVCSQNIPINAVWLGADPTGSADSATAINSCVSTAVAVKGKCYIPAGNYKLNSGITASGGVEIYGDHAPGIGGLCAFNNNCASNIAAVSGGTNLIPANAVNGITAITNDSVYIHDLQIVYTALPTTGSGVYGIEISGTGPPFGVNSRSHIWNVSIVQADIGVIFSNAVSFGFDHNLLYNFRTSAIDITGASTATTTGTTNGTTTLTVASATGVYVGSNVRASDITGTTTVTNVVGTTVTLSGAASGSQAGESVTFSTNISGGGDWVVGPDNVFLPGPATGNTCYGTRLLASAAVAIIGNKYNAIPNLTTCAAIYFNPSVDGISYEPVRIVGNSIEGAWAGLAFYNNCTTPSSCSLSQGIVSGNQIWTGAGFQGGLNINVTGASAAQWVNGLVISGNVLNVVGGGSNNFNIVFGAGFVNNAFVTGNLFGNTSAAGSTSIFNGGSNGAIRSAGNQALASDSQSLGTTTTAPFTLACGTLETNTLYNALMVGLYGGTGVTTVSKNGTVVANQGSGALTPFSLMLMPGDTMQVACATPPNAAYSAFNP